MGCRNWARCRVPWGCFRGVVDERLHSAPRSADARLHCPFIPGADVSSDEANPCKAALFSPYSALFRQTYWGGIPISLGALGCFRFFAGLALYLLLAPSRAPRKVIQLYGLTAFGPLAASIVMFTISLTQLHAFCKVCVGIYASSVLLASGPSSEPEEAGILPALLGSIYLGVITVLIAVPLGVGTALYLEEYSGNWLAKVIQINISNLAGVPSVVFGILGAFIFVELIFKPMESPVIAARNVLGGGMTLALLTLPVVIVAAQEAIRAVPVSIRHGAYAAPGATKWQTTWRLVLPCSLPGILTGAILAMARAMGEAAPLVLFGALLFVNQEPTLFSRFTVLPMQVFGWADRPRHPAVASQWRHGQHRLAVRHPASQRGRHLPAATDPGQGSLVGNRQAHQASRYALEKLGMTILRKPEDTGPGLVLRL